MVFIYLHIYIYIHTFQHGTSLGCPSDTSQAFEIIDAQDYLVRQRRNRVWGLIQPKDGDTLQQFRAQWRMSLNETKSHLLFPMEKCFDMSLPTEKLKTERERALLQDALEDALEVL